ncbi:MAG: hypothetical protein R3190_19420, partial [Thermoanaerobaculia bacterium]|nr:hypothetical protein [Thermoanaerobaculia bacterium]
ETATTVARSLVERGAGELRVANRSRERAEAFRAELPQAEILPFEERQQHLGGADLIVAATGAPEPIVRRADVDAVLRQRKGRPLLIVDLGVPRDVEPEVGELRNVFLHDIDSLEQLIEHNLKRRREEVADVEAIVDHELDRFRAWYGGLEAAPVVAQLHRRAEEIRLQEIEKHREKFPAEIHEHLDSLTRSIVRKILHHPSAHLRERSDRENLHHIAVLKDLFRLDEADADPTERDRAGGDEPERDE